ncbi:MAG: hypothetical protein ACOY3Y_09590 [Acidobacteriota bacterium]
MRALLLRPHDFIVEDMKAWLSSSLGLTPVRLRSLAELSSLSPDGVKCTVTSLAVTSEVKATVREAITASRIFAPQAPLLLAGLSTIDKARPGFELELKGLGLDVRAATDATAAWGAPNTVLYVQAGDLKGPGQAALTAAAKAHLKLG